MLAKKGDKLPVTTRIIKKKQRTPGLSYVRAAEVSYKSLFAVVALIFCFLGGVNLRAAVLEISSPSNGATLASPVALSATTSGAVPNEFQVYDNGSLILQESGVSTITAPLTLTPGAHTITVETTGRRGGNGSASVSIIVSIPVSTSPPPASSTVAAQISNDMTGKNEGFPQDVPLSYDWANGPVIDQGNNAGSNQALESWGVIYVASQGSSATNTWVNIANLQAWILSASKGTWSQVQLTSDPGGAAYPDNFQGNSIAGTTRIEADGTLSVLVVNNSGYNFHFYPDNRGSINPKDIGGIVTLVEARLVVGNAALPDDRASANYLVGSGADYYPSVSGPGIQNNPSVGNGKMKYVTNAWRSFAMTTMSAAALASNPPPINLTGINP